MIRRLAAIATWVLLLHLNLIASDLVCVEHHEVSGGAAPAMMHHQAPANTTVNSAVTDGDQQPCQVPSRADCCHAMASCSLSIGLDPSPVGVSPPIVRATAAALPTDAPISFAVAPEPPPPKA